MNTGPFDPGIYPLAALDSEDRARMLLALGTRWTDLLLDLESGPAYLDHALSLTLAVHAAHPYAHPLLSPKNVCDLMTGLHAALNAHSRYENEGVIGDEDVDYLSGLDQPGILAHLWTEVEVWVFRLLHGAEPCTACSRTTDRPSWEPQQAHTALCAAHEHVGVHSVR